MSATAWAELPCDTHTDKDNDSVYLPTPLLDEISGLARSHLNEGIYWAHTDSGGKAELYAIDIQGNHKATVTLKDVQNDDWEDIAVGPCSPENLTESCVFIGDTGDNSFNRTNKQILVFKENALPAKTDTTIEWELLYSISVTYPATTSTEAKFINPDCESLMVDPRDGGIYIVSKQSNGGVQTLYRITPTGEEATMTGVLTALGDYTFTSELGVFKPLFNAVTAADFAPDGTHFVVRTYAYVYEYDVSNKTIAEAFAAPSKQFATGELQGEAIAYAKDGLDIISAAEKYESISPYPMMHINSCVPNPNYNNGGGNECTGDNCEHECTGDNCEHECTGDNCEHECTGDNCEHECTGDNCEHECTGDNCEHECTGDDCGEPCIGKECGGNNGNGENNGNNENGTQDPVQPDPNEHGNNASHGQSSCHCALYHPAAFSWMALLLAAFACFFFRRNKRSRSK